VTAISLRVGPTGVAAGSIAGPGRSRVRVRPLPSSVYWRRRLAVLVVLAGAFLAGGKALEALGGGPLAAAEVRSSPSPAVSAVRAAPPTSPAVRRVHLVATPVRKATYVVQSGDTLWSIARSLQPQGDVRPLVDDLTAGRHGRPLQPGERIELP
jgi:hypothetical protein